MSLSFRPSFCHDATSAGIPILDQSTNNNTRPCSTLRCKKRGEPDSIRRPIDSNQPAAGHPSAAREILIAPRPLVTPESCPTTYLEIARRAARCRCTAFDGLTTDGQTVGNGRTTPPRLSFFCLPWNHFPRRPNRNHASHSHNTHPNRTNRPHTRHGPRQRGGG